MPILALETSTDVCSVALETGDGQIIYREERGFNIHSSRLNILIEAVMLEGNLAFSSLDVICISKGPGSYTGLRIGVSTAKGLCYALDKPLIGINTLQTMVHDAVENTREPVDTLYCPMLDARRMEVYTAVFDRDAYFIRETSAEVVDEYFMKDLLDDQRIVFFGNGMQKCKAVLEKHPNAIFPDTEIYPQAKDLITLAKKRIQAKEFEDIFSFEPYYLKDFFTNQGSGVRNQGSGKQ
jgi:tRNA threonylcarbamoyladenosine biosynthesis protein TsaB